MATLQDYLGITKLRDAWPKWKANVIAINNQIINHVAGTADKHAAQDITYTGDFTGKTEVKAALDQAKTEIDTIVVNASVDPEVALARTSAVKAKTFTSLDARLEEDEQDALSYKAESATKLASANALNPIFVKTYDGSNQLTHPKVLYIPEYFGGVRYWMAYTPYPGGNDDYENPCIAACNDGLRWYTPTGLTNPLATPTALELSAGGHYSDTHLVYRPDTLTLECWYRYGVNDVYEELLRRTTLDGVTWTAEEIITSNNGSEQYLSPAVIYENGKYRMWFVRGHDLMYMESADNCVTWSTATILTLDLPLGYNPWHLDVVVTALGYEMLLNVSRGGLNDKALMCSLSVDGVAWGVFKDSIYPSANKKAFDSQMIYRASFIVKNGFYYVYYSAMSVVPASYWHIGLTSGLSLDSLKGGYIPREDEFGNWYIPQNVTLDNGAGITAGSITLVIAFDGATIKPTDMENTLDVIAYGSSLLGNLRMGGIQFGAGIAVPTNLTNGMVRWFDTEKRLKIFKPSAWNSFQTTISGSTTDRPTLSLEYGQQYYDTNLKKTIVWDGVEWTQYVKLVSVPSLSTSTGKSGEMAYDINYLYTCVATDTWKRTALSAW